MSVYVIATYTITDPKGYEGYVPGVLPLLEKHGAEILVADYEGDALEGQPTGVNVVLKFSSAEAARNPEYSRVKQIRLNSSKDGAFVLTKQFVMPSA